jgi:hypothetical protein
MELINRSLIAAYQSSAKNKMVVIDTCNEYFNKTNVFGVDFSSWNIVEVWVNCDKGQLTAYLAWSLRNVVRRQYNDSVLTPGKAGLNVCISVHLKKARALFGNKISELARETTSLNVLLTQLDPLATDYDQYLAANKDLYAAKLV